MQMIDLSVEMGCVAAGAFICGTLSTICFRLTRARQVVREALKRESDALDKLSMVIEVNTKLKEIIDSHPIDNVVKILENTIKGLKLSKETPFNANKYT